MLFKGGATVEAFLAKDCRVVLVDQDADIGTILLKSLSHRVSIFKMTLRFIILGLRAGHKLNDIFFNFSIEPDRLLLKIVSVRHSVI